jgi:DNA ligase 1
MNTTNIDKNGKSHNSKDIQTGPCVFPFKYKKNLVNECVDGKTGKWCATSVSKRKTVDKWAYCSGEKSSAKINKGKKSKLVIKKKGSMNLENNGKLSAESLRLVTEIMNNSRAILGKPKKLVIKKSKVSKNSSSKNKTKKPKSTNERYFELVEGTHFKYWIIKLESGNKVRTIFGKIGSDGRELVIELDSPEDVLKYVKKKVSEKTRKGYIEKLNSNNRANISMKPVITKSSTKVKSSVNKVSTPTKLKISKIKDKCGSSAYKSVWDVIKNGVMLAHTYRDPKTGKIKNPPKGYPSAPNGWFLSEKFDGYRCIWDGEKFYSRLGNEFKTPDWFRAFLPPGVALDGELFLGREGFQKCGIFRKKSTDDAKWMKLDVKYQIFDSPTHPGGFEDRQLFIEKLIEARCKCDKKKLGIPSGIKCPLIMTKQIKVKNDSDVQKHFKALTSKGAEGVMLRAPNSPYDPKRTSLLLKVKQFFDDECKIIGYKPGTAKYLGMLGSFHCQMVKDPKIKFDISGMDDEIRKNYKKTHPIGTIVTFTYMGKSTSGTPRHPNYLRIRK